MAKATLTLHRGARLVSLEELTEKENSTEWEKWKHQGDTYKHIPYSLILRIFIKKARSLGFPCPELSLGVTETGGRFFGVVNLNAKDDSPKDDLGLVMGLRSSHEGSFAVKVNLGSRVFVCDNLMFAASGLITNSVRAKHHGRAQRDDFGLGMESMVELQLAAMADSLLSVVDEYRVKSAATASWLKETLIEDDEAKLLLWKLRDRGAIADGEMPKTFDVWKNPAFEAFQDHADTLWGLYNAITSPDILGKKPFHLQGEAHLRINESGLFLPPAEVLESVQKVEEETPEEEDEDITEEEEEEEEYSLPM